MDEACPRETLVLSLPELEAQLTELAGHLNAANRFRGNARDWQRQIRGSARGAAIRRLVESAGRTAALDCRNRP